MDMGEVIRELEVEPIAWPLEMPQEAPATPERIEEEVPA